MKTNTHDLTCWTARVAALFAVLALPFSALAHEKWFVEKLPQGMTKPALFSSLGAFSLSLLVIASLSFIAMLFLHIGTAKNLKMKELLAKINPFRIWNAPLLRSLTGVVLFMATFGVFFAPDLHTLDRLRKYFSLTATIDRSRARGRVLSSLCQWYGLLLYLGAFFVFPFMDVIPYISLAGIFTYLLIMEIRRYPTSVDF